MSWGPRNVPVLLRYKSADARAIRTGIGWLIRAVLTWNFRGFKTCWINSWCYCYFHENHTSTSTEARWALTVLTAATPAYAALLRKVGQTHHDDLPILDCKSTKKIGNIGLFYWKNETDYSILATIINSFVYLNAYYSIIIRNTPHFSHFWHQ